MGLNEDLIMMKMNKIELNEIIDYIKDVHDLKPNQILKNNQGTCFKSYYARKPESIKIPKPFPLKCGITLTEDGYGWYTLSGEMFLNVD